MKNSIIGLLLFSLFHCGYLDTAEGKALTNEEQTQLSAKFMMSLQDYVFDYVFKDMSSCVPYYQGHYPTDFVTGFLKVPENWDQPAGTFIRIFFMARIPESWNPAKSSPIIYFPGGPAQDAAETVPPLLDYIEDQVPFVYLDYRGTGCSSSFPDAYTPENFQLLKRYSSAAIVKDAEALRQRLFPENIHWTILGHSYGTWVAHRYLELFPQSISSIHLVAGAITQRPVDDPTARMLAQKKLVAQYFVRHPEHLVRLKRIKKRFPPHQCLGPADVSICGPQALDALVYTIATDPNSNFQDLFQSMEAGPSLSLGPLDQIIHEVNERRFPQDVISWYDGAWDADVYACDQIEKNLKSRGENPNRWPLNECRFSRALKRPWVRQMITETSQIRPISLEKIRNHLLAFPHLRIYFYSAGQDGMSPQTTFTWELEYLSPLGPRVQAWHFPEEDHSLILRSDLLKMVEKSALP